jgi:hypothetical protein
MMMIGHSVPILNLTSPSPPLLLLLLALYQVLAETAASCLVGVEKVAKRQDRLTAQVMGQVVVVAV